MNSTTKCPLNFSDEVLGRYRKYSCGLWEPGCTSLEQSEADMLRLSCQRAELQDGQSVLELGCGWGSLSLWMARHYPGSQITAVSNSQSQRRWIEQCVQQEGLDNLTVITADMRDFSIDQQFDRVVSSGDV